MPEIKLEQQTSSNENNVASFVQSFSDISNFENQSNPFSMIFNDITGTKEKLTSFKSLENDHLIFLNNIGLSISEDSTGGFTRVNGKEIHKVKIKIDISDYEKFNTFLKTIEKGSDNLIPGLKKISQSVVDQLRGVNRDILSRESESSDKYNLDTLNDDRMVNLFGSIETMISEYNRIDNKENSELDKSVKPLEIYLEKSRQGYLKEYILIENLNIIGIENIKKYNSPEVFQWNLEPFREKWGSILEKIKEITKNDSTKDFFQKIVKDLIDSQIKFKNDLLNEKKRISNLIEQNKEIDREEMEKKWGAWEKSINEYLEELINYE
jgi:hypothetical protein